MYAPRNFVKNSNWQFHYIRQLPRYDYIIKQLPSRLGGAVEYTNCFSVEKQDPLTTFLDMTLNNVIMMFQ